MLGLLLFIVTLSICYKSIGRAIRSSDNSIEHISFWLLGVALFAHCTAFIGTSYFGQINTIWYLLLAMIGSLASYRGTAK